jgi:hypothetical protein
MYSTSAYYTRFLYAGTVDARFPAMIEHDAVAAALVNIPELARMTGLSPHTIRSLLLKRRRLRGPTRRKLAAALRQHSATLSALADQLDGA